MWMCRKLHLHSEQKEILAEKQFRILQLELEPANWDYSFIIIIISLVRLCHHHPSGLFDQGLSLFPLEPPAFYMLNLISVGAIGKTLCTKELRLYQLRSFSSYQFSPWMFFALSYISEKMWTCDKMSRLWLLAIKPSSEAALLVHGCFPLFLSHRFGAR